MSRWIDADRLLTERMKSKYYHLPNGDTAIPIIDIERAPSIDIVRCGECKYCSKDRIKWSVKDEDGNWIDTKCNLCRRTKLEVNLDDFCSSGERKDNGKDIQSATE